MNQASILQQEAVDGGSVNAAALEGEVLEIAAGLGQTFEVPLLAQLNAASQIEITDEGSGGGDDGDERFGRNVLVELGRVHVAPQLAVKAHVLPLLGDGRAADDLSRLQV